MGMFLRGTFLVRFTRLGLFMLLLGRMVLLGIMVLLGKIVFGRMVLLLLLFIRVLLVKSGLLAYSVGWWFSCNLMFGALKNTLRGPLLGLLEKLGSTEDMFLRGNEEGGPFT